MRAASQRRLTPMLVLAAVVIGTLLLVLLLGLGRGVHWDEAHAPTPLPPARSGVKMEPPTPLEHYAAVWQKPLFDPSRKPTASAAQATSVGDLELTGVIITHTLKMALLREKNTDGSEPDNGKNGHTDLSVIEGKELPNGGWTLAEVHPRSVLFDSPQGRVELKLPAGAPITASKNDPDAQGKPGAAEVTRGGSQLPSDDAGSSDSGRGGLSPESERQRPRQSDAALQNERLQRIRAAIQKRRAEQSAPATEGER